MSTASVTTSWAPGSVAGVVLDPPLFEVINGTEVDQPVMGVYEGVISSLLSRKLGNFAEEQNLGQVVSEVLFRLTPGKSSMLRPDVAFVAYDRWGQDQDLTSGHGWDVVPNLAVEVISPTDLAVEVMTKVYEYLAAGVVEVWLIYPELRRVHRFGAGGAITCVGPEGILDGGTVLPGWQLALTELFRNKA